jgi:dTDP-4-dehydrorhamnose 3,5-epimerase
MQLQPTPFQGLFLLTPKVFSDGRGAFFESYNFRTFEGLGLGTRFVQDNQSISKFGVVRGLHFQAGDKAQAKLVRALSGKILDVAVDLRQGSATFGRAFSVELSAENNLQLFIPKGFAHGFSTLSESATVFYKCDEFYDPAADTGIHPLDKNLKIDWGLRPDKVILSDKDRHLPPFSLRAEISSRK